jgi:hypothetical protein
VQHEDRGRPRVRDEEEGVGAVIDRAAAGAGRVPPEDWQASARFLLGLGIDGRRDEEIGRRQALAFLHVGLQGGAAAAIKQLPPLDVIHHHAHDEVECARHLAAEDPHGVLSVRRRMGDWGRSSSVR